MKEADQIALLSDLIHQDTAGGFEDRTAVVLKSFMQKWGIDHEIIPVMHGRSNFYARLGENKNGKALAFCGHQDVVKTEDPKAWKFPPFSAHIENGRMYGRGTADMKGGLAAMAIAMAEIKEAGIELNGRLDLMGTIAEESSRVNRMQGAHEFAVDGYADDVTAAIFGEPTGGDIAYAHKGSVTIRVVSKGKAAHSSRPELGFNAIPPLMHFYQAQTAYFDQLVQDHVNPVLGPVVPVVTHIGGGEQLNAVPDFAEICTMVRTIPEVKNQKVVADVQAIVDEINDLDGAHLSLEVLSEKIAVATDRNAEIVKTAENAAKTHLNQNFAVRGMAFGTDASELTKNNPNMDILVFGPGNATAHKIDEYIEIDQYLNMIKTYKQIALDYLA